jgi:hypothetical protein
MSKFNEHMHVEKKEFDKGRVICMCERHKKRIYHCQCERINPCIYHSPRIWGSYEQLKFTGLFTEQEIISALNDYD